MINILLLQKITTAENVPARLAPTSLASKSDAGRF